MFSFLRKQEEIPWFPCSIFRNCNSSRISLRSTIAQNIRTNSFELATTKLKVSTLLRIPSIFVQSAYKSKTRTYELSTWLSYLFTLFNNFYMCFNSRIKIINSYYLDIFIKILIRILILIICSIIVLSVSSNITLILIRFINIKKKIWIHNAKD